ncbi:hypothetical protein MBGDC06_00477 [Thermoplasmatales archaeon SCGC AB-539-C06]|nr:hypothetical protein MBGDC06_00477 [Thermoplasmatales archaeon SCGC AB-539-C06]
MEYILNLNCANLKNSDEFAIRIHFDQNAPNLSRKGENYSWMPTKEEMNIMNEASELIAANNIERPYEKTSYTPPVNNTSPKPPVNHEGKNTFDTPPLETSEKTTYREETNNGYENNYSNNKIGQDENKISVSESDRQAIEAALEKHRENNNFLSESDEQKIIERILNQKKQNIQGQEY